MILFRISNNAISNVKSYFGFDYKLPLYFKIKNPPNFG